MVVFPRCRAIAKSGPYSRWMDRQRERVQAVGFTHKFPRARGQLLDESGCIPAVRRKCRWRTWPSSGLPLIGSDFARL